MKAPIWFILARLDIHAGSTGWHRAQLIDTAIGHFNEWWLFGTHYTVHWMPYALSSNPDMIDITNQYLKFGVQGGIISMALFILVIIRSFKGIGEALDAIPPKHGKEKFFVWCLGVTLFGYVIQFFSISYFDQSVIFIYMLLAIISNMTELSWEKGFGKTEDCGNDLFRNTYNRRFGIRWQHTGPTTRRRWCDSGERVRWWVRQPTQQLQDKPERINMI